MKKDKILDINRKYLIIASILILISIIMYSGIAKLEQTKEKEKCIDYNTLISSKKDTEKKYVKVTMFSLPYKFAVKEEGETKQNYYFIYDQYNFLYITRLTDKTYQKIEEKYNQDPENFSYELRGYIYNIPSQLKELALSEFNKAIENKTITNENFEDYFGKTYLDETLTPYTEIIGILFGIGILLDMFGIACLIAYIAMYIRTKKTLKKYNKQELQEELYNAEMSSYSKAKIYLTNKYIISTVSGLTVIEYDDLFWIYIENRRQNGISIGKYLIAVNMKKKKINLAYTYKNEDLLIEIMNKIKENKDSIKVGFTKENQKAFRNLK